MVKEETFVPRGRGGGRGGAGKNNSGYLINIINYFQHVSVDCGSKLDATYVL